MNHAAVVYTSVVLALAGCQSKSPAKPAETPGESVVTNTNAADEAERAEVKEAPEEPAATTCRDDRDCEGYLRCEDAVCTVPPAVEGRVVDGMSVATFTSEDGQELASFHLEIADQSWERTRGLMFRRKMDPEFGMLFVFPDEAERSFWMKNTLIPLDMVHIDAAGTVVGVVAKAEPLTLSPRRTGEPARYVLELTSGRAAEVGIVPGAKMSVTNLPEDLAPR